MTDPSYLIWTPRLLAQTRSSFVVRFNVTPLAIAQWPMGDSPYYAQILGDIGFNNVEAEDWQVVPYRCRYHGDAEAETWQDRWRLNWRVTVQASGDFRQPDCFEEGYETYAHCDKDIYLSDGKTHLFVLADYKKRSSLDQAVEMITLKLSGIANVEVFQVERKFWQLQVDLGVKILCDDASSRDQADAISDLCRSCAGLPTFEERIIAFR
jgi:hypothetical protein